MDNRLFVGKPKDSKEGYLKKIKILLRGKEKDSMPKTWWSNPYLKGLMYTMGVFSALFLISLISIFFNYIWPGFEWFTLLQSGSD